MNDKLSRVLFLMLGVLMLVSCSHKDNSMFSGLDYQMSMSPTYDAKKLSQIESLKLISRDLDRNGQFRTLMRIGEEYESFQFDSSLTYFSAALQVARQTGGKDDIDLANIRLGRLYTRAGHFLEANTTLFERIDPSSLSPAIQGEYYAAVLKYAGDLTGNSGVYDYCELPDIDQARKDFYSSADPASLMYAEVKISEMLYGDRLPGADSLCRAILARIPDSDRDYAMFAWYQSQICEYLGQSQERMEWLVKSAEADMINSVKDYASLTLIAQSLMDIDMNRSFRYYVRSFNDATSYNAKLRPWQIAQSFNQIQQAYNRQIAIERRHQMIATIVMSLLSLVLLLAVAFIIRRYKDLDNVRKELNAVNEEMARKNERLSELNREINEANSLKEEYIGLFLGILSEDINKRRSFRNTVRNMLKQGHRDELMSLVSDETKEEEILRSFYDTFDTTFLALFPTFVEDFNALLSEGARIYPKKNEALNTELRIYALVRLGIDDSNKIASLLHYSVSTIYNYKVKIRKGALGDKDVFEENVRKIGIIQ